MVSSDFMVLWINLYFDLFLFAAILSSDYTLEDTKWAIITYKLKS